MVKNNGDGNILKTWDISKDDVSSKDGKFSKNGEFSKDGKLSNNGKNGLNILSAREQEVLKLLSEGCTNKETAKRLTISVRTVETHRKNIMEKINVKNLAGLIKYSIANKLIVLD